MRLRRAPSIAILGACLVVGGSNGFRRCPRNEDRSQQLDSSHDRERDEKPVRRHPAHPDRSTADISARREAPSPPAFSRPLADLAAFPLVDGATSLVRCAGHPSCWLL
jgi:hypothetical protein